MRYLQIVGLLTVFTLAAAGGVTVLAQAPSGAPPPSDGLTDAEIDEMWEDFGRTLDEWEAGNDGGTTATDAGTGVPRLPRDPETGKPVIDMPPGEPASDDYVPMPPDWRPEIDIPLGGDARQWPDWDWIDYWDQQEGWEPYFGGAEDDDDAAAAVGEGEVAAPAAKQEEVAPPPPAAVVHPPSDNAIEHDQGREEDWGLRQREAERARLESRERASGRLGYEDVESMTGVRHGGDPKALSDQIQRLGAAVSVQTDPCICPDEDAAALAAHDAGSAGSVGGGQVGVTDDMMGGPVFEIGDLGGGGLDDSQWDDEEYLKSLEKRRKELRKRRNELEKELADRRKKHLDTEEGKKTKKKLDELEKERQKRLAELEREAIEYRRSLGPQCCGSYLDNKAWEWKMGKKKKIDGDIDKRREDAIDEGMKKTDPDGQKKYQDAREEHKKVEDELRDTGKAIAEEEHKKLLEGADSDGPLPGLE